MSAAVWIKPVLEDALPAGAYGHLLLMPGAQAPVAIQARSRQICTCLNVSEDAIRQQLDRCSGSDDEGLGQLQAQLKCGTQCGSCVPELRRLVRASSVAPALTA